MLESTDKETVLPDLGMAGMLMKRIRYFTDGARKLKDEGAAANEALSSLRDLRKGIA